MKALLVMMLLVLAGSMAGCLKVDAKDASKEWSDVGKSWADAFKEQEQGAGQEQEQVEAPEK